jgi:gluconate 5-dehydrogenase
MTIALHDQTLSRLFDLRGRVAFVPGGYGGIGEAIAWGLALAGAEVVVAGRSADKAQALAQRLRDAGLLAHGLAMDASAVADIRAAM